MDNGNTRRDRMRNDIIQEMAGVVDASKKTQERRLYWYGRVMRKEESPFFKEDAGPAGGNRRPRGRPKRQWRDSIDEDR